MGLATSTRNQKATKPDAVWQSIVVVENWFSQFAQSK